jgi:hypothetical protein
MMRLTTAVALAATVLVTACASDGTTSPNPSIDARLAAVASTPTASVSDPSVTMNVAVTSSLSETVSGGRCAEVVEAKATGGTTWVDVTSKSAVCSTIAIQLAAGQTVTITATADKAAVVAMAGSSKTVMMRARHRLASAATSYTLQSNEVAATLP